MKARSVPEDDEVIVKDLIKQTYGWELKPLEEEIAGKMALFAEGCMAGDRCFDTKVSSALTGIASRYVGIALGSSHEHLDSHRLASALRRDVAFSYMHYRLLRCSFKKNRQADLYGVMLGSFGFVACAAIYAGAEKEAKWLSKEFLRNLEGGYDCPYTLDAEFLAACRWLTTWYLNGQPSDWTGTVPSGLYAPLIESAAQPERSEASMNLVLAERTRRAYRKVVLEDDKADPWFYSSIYQALFPFEVLAFQKLQQRRTGAAFEPAHPILLHLRGLQFDDGVWQEDFPKAVEHRLAQLEQQIGLPAIVE